MKAPLPSPCQNCDRRTIYCHSECKEYAEYAEVVAKRRWHGHQDAVARDYRSNEMRKNMRR